MLPNADKIAKPTKGSIFGLSVPEFLGLLRQYNFRHSEFNKRIDIAMMNPHHASEYGTLLASFCPSDFLALFSLPDSISSVRAKSLSTAAIVEFAVLDQKTRPQWYPQKRMSFRVYLEGMNQLVITERHRSVKLGKYRGSDRFSNAFKPKAIHVEERIIREVKQS